MKTAIVTDSNSGITQTEAGKMGVFVIPMPFIIGEEEYFEDINLTQEEFYQKLLTGEDISTSQPAIGLIFGTRYLKNMMKLYIFLCQVVLVNLAIQHSVLPRITMAAYKWWTTIESRLHKNKPQLMP